MEKCTRKIASANGWVVIKCTMNDHRYTSQPKEFVTLRILPYASSSNGLQMGGPQNNVRSVECSTIGYSLA
jgi:hypothetical protein